MTLVILAAGMGSRYGGLKQIDPIGPSGEFIIDYSIHDAVAAGFDKVVFIIKKENLRDFEETVGKRVSKYVKTAYVFQDLEDLPKGYSVPQGRVKPWGTSHALLCAQSEVHDNFAVINSDDYYGKDTYVKMAEFLRGAADAKPSHYAMCGFILRNTLSENGHVARGICQSCDGMLTGIDERTKIQRNDGVVQFYEEGQGWTDVSEDSLVSMNFWGFTPDFIDELATGFEDFLGSLSANALKAEYLLPTIVDQLLKEKRVDLAVLPSMDHWFGVTFKEDVPYVREAFQDLVSRGVYPEKLFPRNL